MTSAQKHIIPQRDQETRNPAFVEDILDLFMGFRAGHVSKYIYDAPEDLFSGDEEKKVLWTNIIEEDETPYYLPKADNELLTLAKKEIHNLVPLTTPLVDFGVGGIEAFTHHALPILESLESDYYVGLDFCEAYLEQIQRKYKAGQKIKIVTVRDDFFEPKIKTVTPVPSLGLLTCSTIGNIHGGLQDLRVKENLSRALRVLSRLTNNGWLLVSVDTNQEPDSLHKGYRTELLARLFLTVLARIPAELPVAGFDPALFAYDPEWHSDLQLFAHMARATQDQSFTLGSYQLEVKKDQKLHLLNSYKFSAPFFESCCDRAGLDILHIWHHETPVKLYLLRDRARVA